MKIPKEGKNEKKIIEKKMRNEMTQRRQIKTRVRVN